MPVSQVYSNRLHTLPQLWPQERITRVRNMAWLLPELWVAKSIHLSHVALRSPWPIQKAGSGRRLSRFLHNAAVRALAWYEPVARQLPAQAAATQGEVRLLLDTMPVHAHAQVVVVSLAFRHRALPLAWTWVRHGKGHRTAFKQRALLVRVRRWLPAGAQVPLVGDGKFGRVLLIRQPEAWGWEHVLRQKGGIWDSLPPALPGAAHGRPRANASVPGRALDGRPPPSLPPGGPLGAEEGCTVVSGHVSGRTAAGAAGLPAPHGGRRNASGPEKPWLSSQQNPHWGWPRALLPFPAPALLYVWHVATGIEVVKRGRRYWVDRRIAAP